MPYDAQAEWAEQYDGKKRQRSTTTVSMEVEGLDGPIQVSKSSIEESKREAREAEATRKRVAAQEAAKKKRKEAKRLDFCA